jgi:hypothetical protein
MASLRPTMRTAAFTFWDVPARQLPPTWDNAHRRLAEQARADRASTGHTPAADMSTIHHRRRDPSDLAGSLAATRSRPPLYLGYKELNHRR